MKFFNTVLLNKNNLINNIKVIKNKAKNKKICAMVKANAYNHNLKFVVLNLKNYVNFFGVVNSVEALKVRELTHINKILLCGAYKKDELKELILNNVSLTIFSLTQLKEILKLCKELNFKANVHIKINTGMNRYGVKDKSYLLKLLNFIKNNKDYINLEGIFSHFFNNENENLCKNQYIKFLNYVNVIKNFMNKNSLNFSKVLIHIENSGGLFYSRDILNCCNMVRVGISLYGLENYCFKLKPVLSLKSKIVAIQKVKFDDYVGYGKTLIQNEKKVGIIPIGYADGILKRYKDCFVKVEGKFCKILNVCMDCILVDISNTKAKTDSEVEIISSNPKDLNSANYLSKYQNTISYEIVTGLNYNRLNIKEI